MKMKIPQLLLAACALISWTTLNISAKDLDQGITSRDIENLMQKIKREMNATPHIQPGPVENQKSAQTAASCLDRSIRTMKKIGYTPSELEIGNIADMCARAHYSDAPANLEISLQSIKKNLNIKLSDRVFAKIADMCADAHYNDPGTCFDTPIQAMKNTGYTPDPEGFELEKIANMCAGAQSAAPGQCLASSLQSTKASLYLFEKFVDMCVGAR